MVKYWEQPTLTENGIMGGSTFAVASSSDLYSDSNHAWNAFNGELWISRNSLPAWLAWYHPEPVVLESVQIQNRFQYGSSSYAPASYHLECSLDGEIWYALSYDSGCVYSESGVWHPELVVPEFVRGAYKYYRLYISSSYGSYAAINHIKIKASIPSYNSDSDAKYWAGWYQPEMHSSTDYGRVLCTQYLDGCEPWRAVEHKTYTTQPYGWATSYRSDGAWQWSFPKTLRIHRIIFFNRVSPTEDPKVVFEEGQFFGAKGEFGEKFVVQHSRQQVIIDYEGGMETNYLYFEKLGGINSGIGQLIIDAEEEKETLGRQFTSELKEVYSEGKACSKIYHYGKLIWEKPQPEPEVIPEYYEVPVLTENGEIGGDSFACAAWLDDDYAWRLTNPDPESDYWTSSNGFGDPRWFMYYFPIPVAVESLTFDATTLHELDKKNHLPLDYYVYGSNNNEDWYVIGHCSRSSDEYAWISDLNSNEHYHYIKVCMRTNSTAYWASLSYVGGKFRIN